MLIGCYRSAGSEDNDAGSDTMDSGFSADTETETETDTHTSMEDAGVDECDPMDAMSSGDDCDEIDGVTWDGVLCTYVICGCIGTSCHLLYKSIDECVATRASCMKGCRHAEMGESDHGCICGDTQYYHCCPDGMDYCSCVAQTPTREEFLLCGETEPYPW